MLQPRCIALRGTSNALRSTTYESLLFSLSNLSLKTTTTTHLTQTRQASHATQGRANGAAQGPGKRLGAKRAASELVVPGCIIFRQRGAKWWPGENCVMGRDHTISSLVKGYVRYYRDPENHPKRKLIGVVFEQTETLPRGRNMARRRRLGLEPRAMKIVEEADTTELEAGAEEAEPAEIPKPTFSNGYQYRPTNAEIGRAAKESGRDYPVFQPGNRWLAWRLRLIRKKAAEERQAIKARTSSKGKGKKKAPRNRAPVKQTA